MRSRIVAPLVLVVALASACGGFRRGAYWEEASGTDTDSAADTDADAPTFADDVHPLLIDGCAPCHAPGASAGDTGLVLAGDLDADLESALDFIDAEEPAASRLLTKGAGQGHAGGTIFASTGPEAQVILAWIAAGTPP